MSRVACFVSPHGFGHAARACAVLEALSAARPGLEIEIYTTVPRWFFEESLSAPFEWRHLQTDVGFVQRTSMEEDTDATVAALDAFLPVGLPLLDRLARQLEGVSAVVCDISPLGVAAAAHAGVPSVLVENFTWDWIYQAYTGEAPGLAPHAAALARLFSLATVHVQAVPVCRLSPGTLRVAPVARSPRHEREVTRRGLGLGPSERVILVTMGGIPWRFSELDRLSRIDAVFVIPGGSETVSRQGNVVLLPHHGPFFHPDLVAAADGVFSKLGYSTLAEVYCSGRPLAFVPRPRFPESEAIAPWVRRAMPSLSVAPEALADGRWSECVEELLALPARSAPLTGGAARVAEEVAGLLTA